MKINNASIKWHIRVKKLAFIFIGTFVDVINDNHLLTLEFGKPTEQCADRLLLRERKISTVKWLLKNVSIISLRVCQTLPSQGSVKQKYVL